MVKHLPKISPKVTKKECLLSPLELSLVYNLCCYEDTDGWKTREQIINTDGRIIENPFLKFSSDFSNLSNIFQKLISKKLIDVDTKEFKKKGKIRKKKKYRLKRDKNVASWLINQFYGFTVLKLKDGTDVIDFIEGFESTDYRKNYPGLALKSYEKHFDDLINYIEGQINLHKNTVKELTQFRSEIQTHQEEKKQGLIKGSADIKWKLAWMHSMFKGSQELKNLKEVSK